MALIDIGGSLPELTLKNEKGEDIQIANLASEKGVIIFLVPKADTRKVFSSFFSSKQSQDPRAPLKADFFFFLFFSFLSHSWVHESGVWIPR